MSITALTEARRIVGRRDLQAFPPYTRNGGRTCFYLIPDLERFCLHKFNFNFTIKKARRQQDLSVERAKRVHRDSAERHRVSLRTKIVQYAASFWSGQNPFPDTIPNDSLTQQLATFQEFRGRFAPVDKLASFLFPGYRLSLDRTDNASTDEHYLPDPTDEYNAAEASILNDVDCAWIALNMLHQLVDIYQVDYHHKGKGGFVTAWVKAATEWQKTRLLEHLETRLASTILPGRRRQMTLAEVNLHYMRTSIGLCGEHDRALPALFIRPCPGVYRDMPTPEFIRLDALAQRAARLRREHLELFNTVMKAMCSVCPMSDLVTGPGVDAVLEHVRNVHPHHFWRRDDWFIMG